LSEQKQDQIKFVICIPRMKDLKLLESYLRQPASELMNLNPVVVNEIKSVEVETYSAVGTLILLTMATKDDLFHVINLLTSLEIDIRTGTVRVVVYDQLQNDKLNDFLKSKGVLEVIRPTVSFKTFKYKIDKHVRLLGKTANRVRNEKISEFSTEELIAGFETASARMRALMSRVVESSALEHPSDFWILTKPKSVRFVNGKWFISLYGPGPSFGQWELFTKTHNGLDGWVFTPRDPNDRRFYQDSGRWVFYGSKPEFSWEERQWFFISKKPEFVFQQSEVFIHSKFSSLKGGGIRFCANSQAAQSRRELIASTIENDIRVKHLPQKTVEGRINEESEKKSDRDFKIQNEESQEYGGRFGKDFEARKLRYRAYYDCSELKLSLVAVNQSIVMERVWIELVELRERYVVLDAPAKLIDVDDIIELEAFYVEHGVSKKVMINAATQVVESETEVPGENQSSKNLRALVICELSGELEPQFIELIKAFKLRREELNDFFTKAKGVA